MLFVIWLLLIIIGQSTVNDTFTLMFNIYSIKLELVKLTYTTL